MGLQARHSGDHPANVSGWGLTLYPSAAEAGGSLRSPNQRREHGVRGAARDPGRSRAEAARRARGKVRRYCAANRLNRLGTLTYAGEGCHEPAEARRDVGQFFRQLRGLLDVETIPYLWVPEWHRSGHGLHLHFAVGRYVAHPLIAEAWGRGFVNIKWLGGGRRASGLEDARIAARYLSKYVGKAFDEAPVEGLHRYEVAQGYQPATYPITGRTVHEVLDIACEVMDAAPDKVRHSDELPDWAGPPWVWASWPG